TGSIPGTMRAIGLDAVHVEVELVVVDREAAVARDLLLALLDLGIVELLHAAAMEAHEVVVVAALVQLIDRLPALEVVADEEPRLLELREDAVDRGEPDVRMLVQELAVHVLRGEVARLAVLEEVEHAKPRNRHLEAGALEFLRVAHSVKHTAE